LFHDASDIRWHDTRRAPLFEYRLRRKGLRIPKPELCGHVPSACPRSESGHVFETAHRETAEVWIRARRPLGPFKGSNCERPFYQSDDGFGAGKFADTYEKSRILAGCPYMAVKANRSVEPAGIEYVLE